LKSKELEGFTPKLEGFTQSNVLLDIETIRRKESSPTGIRVKIQLSPSGPSLPFLRAFK